ncbi:homogentisate phytyltransferase [Oscillatoria sp. CS-180]|uniref:homogentisate phytyltransferase n=1 Tax=Oscillatoria sp. CS-180 TaxID=3021720 RepID=UPI00232DD100|nr:homogentisate phytyltransferase [Oscillatoria sp. CS-180]MDB9528827.1 homogentisate phytyltransferase [Oscillatoria sp. CS-180]
MSSKPPTVQISLFQTPVPWLTAFWKFSRPHTIIGTSLSVIGVFVIAWTVVQTGTTTPPLNPFSLLLPLVACLAGNVYIVGLNQIEDVEIDRINKPSLPIASGEFSRRDAWSIVTFAGCLSIVLAAFGGWFLLATVLSSLTIGTAYSLPPVRLKRFPFWASTCILTVRGIIVNLGLFLHYSRQLGLPLEIPGRMWALALFVLVFSIVIAIFKDIPDIEGDRRFNISTFTVRLGQARVYQAARLILTACYIGMMAIAPLIAGVNWIFVWVTHAGLLALFWWRSYRVVMPNSNLLEKPITGKSISFSDFYQFIWQLFFLEYFLYPIACLLG